MPTNDELARRAQQAVESILADVRLRSHLGEDEARVLLSWGQVEIEKAAYLALGLSTTEGALAAFDEALARIRATMREVNDLIGERDNLTDAQLRQRLAAVLFPRGEPPPLLIDQVDDLISRLQQLSNLEVVAYLTLLSTTSLRGGHPLPSRVGPRASPADNRSRLYALSTALIGCLVLVVVLAQIWARVPPAASTPTPLPPSKWYQAYFTDPHLPDDPSRHKGGMDQKLVDLINGATMSVDMAAYQLDLDNVIDALLQAQKRNCLVRVVTDADTLNDPKSNRGLRRLQAAGVPVVGGNSEGIMHNKFVIVDGRLVLTGSWDFTEDDTYRNNSSALLIQHPALARNYTLTFEKMWKDKQFGTGRQSTNLTPKLNIKGSAVENYFTPEDRVADRIIARLRAARKSIDFMTYAFTDDNIGDAMRARAKAGVRVRGVFEATGSDTRFSEYPRMKADKLDVWPDGNPYLMSHQVLILDSTTVILGSFPFTRNAQEANDENLLMVDDKDLAAQYTSEFERVYQEAKEAARQP